MRRDVRPAAQVNPLVFRPTTGTSPEQGAIRSAQRAGLVARQSKGQNWSNGGPLMLEHDPEKWVPVFPRDKREAFARRSCSNKKIERDDDSKKSYPALAQLESGQLD